MNRKIILASTSPRRKRLLEQVGIKFEVRASEYEEDMTLVDDPKELVKILALKKGEDVARHYNNEIIIAADTIVVCDNVFIGKPKSEQEAKETLKKLSGREHEVVTGYAVIDTKNNKVINEYDEVKVKFYNLTDQEIDDYIATGEPLDKAGSYGAQDIGAILIEGIRGDFYSVVGLPISKIYRVLKGLDGGN